ncbi:MAG: 50S ribosomal protein L29 [Parcubacteria group bacterium]|nr:50S ribosomal protein L29 [Parcubacteria group bacterium]
MLKAKELRLKTKEELEKALKDERADLADLNFKMVGSQVKKVSEFGKTKKNIAIILTVLNEKK